jgi:hypothetical protein
VESNGDVTLTWQAVSDPFGVFHHYNIYSAGTGVLLGSTPVGPANNSITLAGQNAQNVSSSYVIQSICDGSGPYDSGLSSSITSMLLNVVNPGNGTALLLWNAPFTIPPSGTETFYRIYRETPAGIWTQVGTTPWGVTTFTDTIYVCSGQINYRVEIENASGCASVSSVDGDLFQDILPPYIPSLISASVDTATGQAVLTWNQNAAPDTQGYIILQFISGSGWIIVDTVYGISNTSYTALANGASFDSETYAVVAFDDCLRGTPATFNTSPAGIQHNTVYLELTQNICAKKITLQWNAYNNWSTLTAYEVYMQSGGGLFVLQAVVSPGTLTYTTVSLMPATNYSFIVRAVSGAGDFSLSNRASIFLQQPPQPVYNYLATASIGLSESVTVHTRTDVMAGLDGVRVERSADGNPPFLAVEYTQVISSPVVSVDVSADIHSKSWYYRAVAIDSCGNESIISNVFQTIFLSVVSDPLTFDVQLNWNPPSGWSGAIDYYNIHRVDYSGADQVIANVNSAATTFTDNYGGLIEENGRIVYYVESVETGNIMGFNETASSNPVVVVADPLVWIPNAFTPGGLNPEFKPVISFSNPDLYLFQVYNRWGEKIFETSDLNAGWNGDTYMGPAPFDVYVYRVVFTDAGNVSHTRQGSVTLVR